MRPNAEQKEIIAYNIVAMRKGKFPGWGGGKKCAKEFGVHVAHWSPWEVGTRTPDETSLQRLAEFFDTTVEAIVSPPEDWDSKKIEWRLRKRRKKRKNGTEDETADVAAAFNPPRNFDEATADFMESVKLLMQIQALRDQGALTQQAYQEKMKHIIGVIQFVLKT